MAAFAVLSRSFRPKYSLLGSLYVDSWNNLGSVLVEHKDDMHQRSFSTSSSQRAVLEHLPTKMSSDDGTNPMVILYGWLLAKSKHLEKFGNLYNRHGADVVTVKPNVSEVLRPKKAEEVASTILDTLQSSSNKNKPVLIHGFSVGGYFYSQTLNKIVTDPKYASVQDRIIGQIFDSPVDFNNIPFGVSNAATNNRLLRNTMKLSIESYFSLTRKYTMDEYLARSKLFYTNPVRTPALFLFSDDDPVALPESCERCVSQWKDDLGMDVTSKKWDSSPHVSHFYKHQEEYTSLLVEFLKKIGIIEPTARVDKI